MKVIIEETVSQEFDVEVPEGVDPYEYVSNKYYDGDIILEPGEVEFKQMAFIHPDNSMSEWKEF